MPWSPADIPWPAFDAARLDPDTLRVVKAAALVERNAEDYGSYLKAVFSDDPAFLGQVARWRDEEVRHGEVLGRYAQLADPGFAFRRRLRRFTDGYRIPLGEAGSVRGSRCGELLARCVVEAGTSSLYSALRDATDEPVLKAIGHRIAGDEYRHYKLFLDALRAYRAAEGIGLARRALVAVERLREAEDDELAYAYHAANEPDDRPYDRARCSRAYAERALRLYRPLHIQRLVAMVLKAVGLPPGGRLAGVATFALKRRWPGQARPS